MERLLGREIDAGRLKQGSEEHGPIPVAGKWIMVRGSRQALLHNSRHLLWPEPQGRWNWRQKAVLPCVVQMMTHVLPEACGVILEPGG